MITVGIFPEKISPVERQLIQPHTLIARRLQELWNGGPVNDALSREPMPLSSSDIIGNMEGDDPISQLPDKVLVGIYEDDAENGKDYTKAQILPVEIKNHNVTAEIDQFVDALLAGGAMPVSSMEGASTVAVCAASVESAKVHKPIQIQYPHI